MTAPLPDPEGFVAAVARAMKRQGITQVELAERMGVGQPAVSMVLSRKRRPQRRTVEKFAAALGVTPKKLWPAYRPGG
jgi:transcriptional regulator with XRE-family HTH domain